MHTFYYPHLLRRAWEVFRAKQSDKKGKTRLEIIEIEASLSEEIEKLSDGLMRHTYVPEPYRELSIPKRDGEFRVLTLAEVRDKWVQQAILLDIQPELEKLFLDCSYGYRQGKGPERAVKRVWDYIAHREKKYAVRCDFDNFFDSIPHVRLAAILMKYLNDSELVYWIMLFMKMGRITEKGEWRSVEKGIPQGALLSPLISNLFLHEFDVFLAKHPVGYVRYADDFVVLTRTEGEAKDIFQKIETFIEKHLGVGLNPDKRVCPISDGFTFLGISFETGCYGLGEEKRKDLCEKIRESAFLTSDNCLNPGLFETLDGISAYYSKLVPENELLPLDVVLASCLGGEVKSRAKTLKTQKMVREIMAPLRFFTVLYNENKKHWIKNIVGSGKPSYQRVHPVTEISTEIGKNLKARKKEYESRVSAGKELLISTPNVRVGVSKGGLTVKVGEKDLITTPTANVKHITIASDGFSLSSNLLFYCQRKGIPIDILNKEGKVLSKFYHADTIDFVRWAAQMQAADSPKALYLAQRWVKAKIRSQVSVLRLLQRALRRSPEHLLHKALPKIIEEMTSSVDSVMKLNEAQCLDFRNVLMGYEGMASRVYWEGVRLRLGEAANFESRTGQGARDAFNASLNYGYGILYTKVWTALLHAGLSPYIGFHHTNEPDKPALVYDFIEEFRQAAVDRVILTLFSKGKPPEMSKGYLTAASRTQIAEGVIARLNVLETFRGHRISLNNIIYSQALYLSDFLFDKTQSYLPYILKW